MFKRQKRDLTTLLILMLFVFSISVNFSRLFAQDNILSKDLVTNPKTYQGKDVSFEAIYQGSESKGKHFILFAIDEADKVFNPSVSIYCSTQILLDVNIKLLDILTVTGQIKKVKKDRIEVTAYIVERTNRVGSYEEVLLKELCANLKEYIGKYVTLTLIYDCIPGDGENEGIFLMSDLPEKNTYVTLKGNKLLGPMFLSEGMLIGYLPRERFSEIENLKPKGFINYSEEEIQEILAMFKAGSSMLPPAFNATTVKVSGQIQNIKSDSVAALIAHRLEYVASIRGEKFKVPGMKVQRIEVIEEFTIPFK